MISSRTIENSVMKLSTHVQQVWLKVAYKIIKWGRKPLFGDPAEFVMEQCDIGYMRYGLLVIHSSNSDNIDVVGKVNADYNITRITYRSTIDDEVASCFLHYWNTVSYTLINSHSV